MGEVCDLNSPYCTSGGFEGTRSCNSQCDELSSCNTAGFCGDSYINPGEECDDGNTKSGDGCSFNCKIELRSRSIVFYLMVLMTLNVKMKEYLEMGEARKIVIVGMMKRKE